MTPALFLVLCLSQAYSLKSGVSPTQKVIQLLRDMQAKGTQEKQDEQVRFAAYKQFCDDTSAEKQASIEAGNDMIEQLQADIQKAESDAAVLASEIAKLNSDIGGWTNDQAEAKSIRTKEHDDFSATHRDYSESLDALDRAIIVLKKQSFDRKQAEMLLQTVTALGRVPASAKRTIASFLATDSEVAQDPLSVSAPQANAYEFQSGGVVDMLQNLKDKFEDERNALEKEEMNAAHAFEMLSQELGDSTQAAQNEEGQKAKTKSQRQQDAAEAKGDLADTTNARDEDTKYLDSLVAQCSQKSSDFESRQQLRSEESEAISKAIEILSSGAVQGNADKHLGGFVQKHSFALRASAEVKPIQKSVAAFLQARATSLQSRILSTLAEHVRDDPFGKVKKMIKGMVDRLLEEANEEAEHKGWCDTELGTNKHTRDAKTEQVNTLTAQVDQLKADIARLGQETADLSQAIAAIDAAVAKATKQRGEESAKNKETIQDSKDAQTAVAQALGVLKEFYAKAATATSLVQQPESDAPETFDTPYTGMGDSAGGVVGMLEVIQSDFARLEAETSTSESTSAKEFERFSAESSKDKAVKSTDLDHKKRTATQKQSDLNDTQKDLSGTVRELDAANRYFDKLKPSCLDAGVSYDERVTRREEEIQSLREALRILSGDDI